MADPDVTADSVTGNVCGGVTFIATITPNNTGVDYLFRYALTSGGVPTGTVVYGAAPISGDSPIEVSATVPPGTLTASTEYYWDAVATYDSGDYPSTTESFESGGPCPPSANVHFAL